MSFVNVVQALGIGLFLSYVFWQSLNAKALIFFVMSLIIMEVIILIRSRLAIPCPHCGFDPHIYLKSQSRACDLVKKHIVLRQNDPAVWLARKPPLRMRPRRKKSTQEIIV